MDIEIKDEDLKAALENDFKTLQEKNAKSYEYNTSGFIENMNKVNKSSFNLDVMTYKKIFDRNR